jgi:hypothetical protein
VTMAKLLVVAAAAVVRHQYEGKYRRMAEEEGINRKMPFSMLVKKLTKAGRIELTQRAKLIDRYKFLSELIH